MYRFLLTPRWIALNLLVILLIPVMIKLGFWQYHRYEGKVERNDRLSANRDHAPVPVTDLFAVGRDLPTADQWRQATATGVYDASHEVLVRQRTNDNVIGFYVVTPLVLPDRTALLVNRGWVRSTDDATARPDVPAAPSGQVTVVVRARPTETYKRSGIHDRETPAGQVMRIETDKLAEQMPGYRLYGGYGQLVDETPKPAKQATLLGTPDAEDIGLNLAYAVQWWLFVVGMLFMWYKIVRREAAELEAELAALGEPDAEDADAKAETAAAAQGS